MPIPLVVIAAPFVGGAIGLALAKATDKLEHKAYELKQQREAEKAERDAIFIRLTVADYIEEEVKKEVTRQLNLELEDYDKKYEQDLKNFGNPEDY